ncbi:MAG: cell filamentation protein Fic, partial [Candidatus Marinimicrobia bacterium]|nr:cell filamentation protein Fic [Candidatus Neomarinimicrobiota bacterium]
MNPSLSSKEIHDSVNLNISYATLKRILTQLIIEKLIIFKGNGRGRKYLLSPTYELLYPINLTNYFEKEIDERTIRDSYNFSLIDDVLSTAQLFTEKELMYLDDLQKQFKDNISILSDMGYAKELERLAIDLSWKSSQIEGNTYSLLETEHLLKEKERAKGKSKDEAIMLLNHKEAIDFIVEHPDYVKPLTTLRIEDIHSILVKDLGIEQNIRKRRVGISGTNYKPLDNEYQIKEALNDMCELI